MVRFALPRGDFQREFQRDMHSYSSSDVADRKTGQGRDYFTEILLVPATIMLKHLVLFP